MATPSIISKFSDNYDIGSPSRSGGLTVCPLIRRGEGPAIISIEQAEEAELGWVQESKSESVQELEAVNKGRVPILIPYLHQVEGGKQDRTVFQPVLVPAGRDEQNPLKIPARCIEQSRWQYSTSRGAKTTGKFRSAKTRLSSQMSVAAMKGKAQAQVWNTISSAEQAMNMKTGDAPTHSYREMNKKAFEGEDLKKALDDLGGSMEVDGQVGIVCLWGSKVLGLELYGSPKMWTEVGEDVLKGYLLDRYFLTEAKDEQVPSVQITELIDAEVSSMVPSSEEAAGEGALYSLSNNEWEGMTLLLGEEPVHFIAAKQHVKVGGDPPSDVQMRRQRMRSSNQQYFDDEEG